MKLKGIELNGIYEVKFGDRWLDVYNENGKHIYTEFKDGDWYRNEYDEKGNCIYGEDNDGIWFKREYDKNGKVIYCENSAGEIIDNRVKELTIKEIEKLLGYKIKIKGE